MKKRSTILLLCIVSLSLGACQNKKSEKKSPEKNEVSSEIKEEKIEKKTNPATVTVVDEDQNDDK